MFDLQAYRANKAAAKAHALAQKAKAEKAESVRERAEKYADQKVSSSVKETLFGEMHHAIGVEEGCKHQVDKAEVQANAIDADKKALAKLELDLDVIYGNIVDLQDKTETLRAQTKADKAAVEEKLEEIKLTSVSNRIAKARAAKATKSVKSV